MQSRKYSLGNAVPDPVSVFPCFIVSDFFLGLNSEIFCGCGCVRDRDGTRCTSVIVLKLIGNSIKGKKKFHLKFIFSVESMLVILSIHCSFLHYDHIDTMGLPYVSP